MTVDEAVAYAAVMHEGQTDKAGRPYLEHPVRVMEALRRERFRSAQALGKPELLEGPQASAELIAAVLHDVLEDTAATPAELFALGVPSSAVTAIQALTRRRGETYGAFIGRAAAHPIARRVKRADIADNADESRLSRLATREAGRLRAKYRAGLAELEEWERYWAVVETQSGQPGGYFQYFLDGPMLGRQWRWRESGAERTFAWPELIHPVATGGLWKAAGRDALRGAEISLERAAQEAAALGVGLDAPRARDWTENGAVVRFGGFVAVDEPAPPAEALKEEAPALGPVWRAVLGAAAGIGLAALFQRFGASSRRKPDA